jgi:GT2 family glycosyltransferase
MAQDVPTHVYAVDNGSTDGTKQWLLKIGSLLIDNENNVGVTKAWNDGLGVLFTSPNVEHALVINNDVVLPPWFYGELLRYQVAFVSGVSVNQMEQITERPARSPLVPSPDFSAFLIHREAWEKVGPFDERMKIYASDNDFHVRAHRKGVQLWKANLPFYHERSSTLKLAPEEERQAIQEQANKDREVFQSLYGCQPWGAGYDDLFK